MFGARRIFHGYRVMAAGAMLMLLQAMFVIQGYGQFAVKLESEFGWSKTFLSAGYSLNRAESGLLGPLQGWAIDRFGVGRVARVGVVMMSAGLLGFSQVNSKTMFLVAMISISVGAGLSGFLSVTTATVQWFERRRAKALSIQSIGFALGGVLIPVFVFSLNNLGWRQTAAGAGIIYLVVAYPLTHVLEGGPAERGEFVDDIDPSTVDNRSTVRAEGVTDLHFTAGQALRTRAFWLISLGHAFALLIVGVVIAHLALFLTDDKGYSQQRASLVAGAITAFQIVGMLIGGALGDRLNKRLLASIAMVGHSAGLFLLATSTNVWMILAFVPLHGLAWGVRGPLMQALRADYFGSTHFGKIMGYSSMIVMFGTIGGPLFAGFLADKTGDYQLGLTILAFVAFLGVVFFALATPPTHPDSESNSAVEAQ